MVERPSKADRLFAPTQRTLTCVQDSGLWGQSPNGSSPFSHEAHALTGETATAHTLTLINTHNAAPRRRLSGVKRVPKTTAVASPLSERRSRPLAVAGLRTPHQAARLRDSALPPPRAVSTQNACEPQEVTRGYFSSAGWQGTGRLTTREYRCRRCAGREWTDH